VSASSPVVSAQVFVGLGGGADDSWPPAYGRSRSPIGTRDSGLHVVIGGISSGKTAVADDVASRLSSGRPIVCLATAPALSIDAETGTRTASYRARRPSSWIGVKATCDLATAVADEPMTGVSDVILLADIGVPVL
jgi:Cobinamide kinase / cobinamide phosphate guanyltransferase